MTRPWHLWTLFGVCLAVVLAAMGWLSVIILRLEQAEAAARRQAMIEENVRLALWRMDSALATLIAQESGRPYFVYSAFYPAERAYTRMFSELEFGEVLVPSPLLTRTSPYILLHFQIDDVGEISSPQVPAGKLRELAEPRFVAAEAIEVAAAQLEGLRRVVDPEALVRALPLEAAEPVAAIRMPPEAQDGVQVVEQREDVPPQVAQQQSLRNVMETQARSRKIQRAAISGNRPWNEPMPSGDVWAGPVVPVWVDSVLLLGRRVSVAGAEYVQGCWLDWPAIQAWLCTEVEDLFPQARLEAVREGQRDGGDRVLAALPAQFVSGPLTLEPAEVQSPLRVSLAVAWSCALLAAIAVVVLLTGTVALSERRAAFVSAVTHELRTPLTTFRLYTEMLADGMLADEAKKREYLETLQAEANRLSHLVENVLAYARLERGRSGQQVEVERLGNLIERVRPRLSARARQTGMELDVATFDERVAAAEVRVNGAAVEQVLFNLVDNACKYAAQGEPRMIHLSVGLGPGVGVVGVRDHGPGIAAADARRLFRPFRKSAREAAHSAPGVGLGLALSRRLARATGGDLVLAQCEGGGACFELRLPLA